MSKVIRYFGKSFEVPYIDRDSYIPVGGTSQFTDETDAKAFVDWNGLESLVQEMRDRASKYDRLIANQESNATFLRQSF